MPLDPFALGIDPGFANFGWGIVDLRKRRVAEAGTLETIKSTTKQGVYASDDTFRRTEEIARFLLGKAKKYELRVLTAESISYPRNASVAAKIAMSWGVVATLTAHLNIPAVFTTPKQLRLNLCNDKNATKEDLAECVIEAYGTDWAPEMAHGKLEHMCDALATVIAAEASPVMRAIR